VRGLNLAGLSLETFASYGRDGCRFVNDNAAAIVKEQPTWPHSQLLALFGVNQLRSAPELEAKTIILLSISRPGAFNRLLVILGMKIVAVADMTLLIEKIAPVASQSHGRLLSLSRLALRQPDTWPAAVLADELDAGFFERALNSCHCPRFKFFAALEPNHRVMGYLGR
jgi:hypothetical protein